MSVPRAFLFGSMLALALALAAAGPAPRFRHRAGAPSGPPLRVTRLPAAAELRQPAGEAHASSHRLRVIPSDHGGDPTGRRDSTAALQACLEVCLNQSSLSPNGIFPSFSDGSAIKDAGGCLIDLDGGEYLISQPLVIPAMVANMGIGFGSIVASDSFPPGDDNFLVVVGTGACKYPQGSCNLDINFPSIFLDGRRRAQCLQVNHVMGATLGPGSYLLNFTKAGVQINGGHELMIDRTWLGEVNYDYDFRKLGSRPNATAIAINGNDHYVLNTIVFASRIGVEVLGAANYISGTHVWFPENIALLFNDSRAFSIGASGNRFVNCYIDGGRAVFYGGGLSKNIWEEGFECCAAVGGVPHGIILETGANGTIGPGLVIADNQFNSGTVQQMASVDDPTMPTDSVTVTDSDISRNIFGSPTGVGTKARQTMVVTAAGSTFSFDFCARLVVPQIASVHILGVQSSSGTATAVARPPQGCKVDIVTSAALSPNDIITVEVDSSVYSGHLV